MAQEVLEEPYDRFYLKHLQQVDGNEAKYYNQRFIGRGGNGTAFLVTSATDSNKGLQFAIKFFHKISDDKRREAFLREIEHLRKLNHPSIIDIFDDGIFTVKDRIYPFAVVEYVPLTTRRLLLSPEGVSRVRAIRISMNCLSALISIHGQEDPLLHRDIKPENI